MHALFLHLGIELLLEYLQEDLAYHDPEKKQYHLCIVNLVIGWDDFYIFLFAASVIFVHPLTGE